MNSGMNSEGDSESQDKRGENNEENIASQENSENDMVFRDSEQRGLMQQLAVVVSLGPRRRRWPPSEITNFVARARSRIS